MNTVLIKKLRNMLIPAIFALTIMFFVVLVSGAFSSGNAGTGVSGGSHTGGCPRKP